MALIKLGALATDISGKVGGSVFQRTASGITLRNEPSHVKSRNSLTCTQRATMGVVQAAWQNLSTAQRTAWEVYAVYRNKSQRKNPQAKMTGHQIFIYENILRWTLRLVLPNLNPYIITSPVIQLPPDQVEVVAVHNYGTSFVISTDTEFTDSMDHAIVYMSRPLTKSQLTQNNKYQLIFANSGTGNAWNIKTTYIDKFGSLPAVGQFVNVKISKGICDTNGLANFTESRQEVFS